MLKKIVVENFKSLKNCEIEFNKFNVIIGKNSSGKSNLIEVFKILKKIYIDNDPYPFLEWWGYKNIVWNGEETLPITIKLIFEINNVETIFETIFTGTGGKFEILRERLFVKGYSEIICENKNIVITNNKKLIEELGKSDVKISLEYCSKFKKDNNNSVLLKIPVGKYRVISGHNNTIPYELVKLESLSNSPKIIMPKLNKKEHIQYIILNYINSLISFPPHIKSLKEPQRPLKDNNLKESSINLINVVYNIFLENGGKLPEEIISPLNQLFPDIRIIFQLTDDGRVLMKLIKDNNIELFPPSISDGFYKVLLLLTIAYLNKPLVFIDEIENSLYPESLKLVVDCLKNSNSQIILTTHSPILVDMTEPKNVCYVLKEYGESNFIKPKNPEELKDKLNKLGLTFSEGWLYGDIFNM